MPTAKRRGPDDRAKGQPRRRSSRAGAYDGARCPRVGRLVLGVWDFDRLFAFARAAAASSARAAAARAASASATANSGPMTARKASPEEGPRATYLHARDEIREQTATELRSEVVRLRRAIDGLAGLSRSGARIEARELVNVLADCARTLDAVEDFLTSPMRELAP
jgi:hypothetical protein